MFENIKGLSGYSVDISDFSTNLFSLWTGLESFQDHSSKLTDPDNDYGLKFIRALANEVPNLHLLSTTDVNGLITKISGLGGAMILYARGAKQVADEGGIEIGEDDLPDVTAAVKLMQAISQSLVDEGGFIIPENMPTDEEFGTFGAQLAALAGALIEFENAGSGLGAGYENGKKALEYFKQLKQDLIDIKYDDIREAIQIFGDEEGTKIHPDDLTGFGTRITELGKALSDFAIATQYKDETTGEMKPVDYSAAIGSLESFKKLEEDLKRIGNGGYLATLGGEIQTLGTNLKDFATKIVGDGTKENPGVDLSDNKVGSAMDLVDEMISAMERAKSSLPRVGGLVGFFETLAIGRSTSLTDIGNEMGKLGEGLADFGSKINGKMPKNTSDITTALAAVDGIVSLVMHIASADKQVYSSNLNQYAESLNTFLQAFLNGLQLDDGSNDFYGGLEAMIEIMQWISGELDKVPEISIDNLTKFELLTRALNNLASIDLSKTADFENIGLSIVSGIANGIKNNVSLITEAAEAAAIAAYDAAMERLKAASPSKLFMDVGSYIGLGMAIGIDNSSKEVADSATGMSEEAIDSARDMIGLISRIMAEGTDATPTIAPILDMTNINEGMAAFKESLNGYGINLDTAYSAGRAAQIGTSSYTDTEALKPDYSGIYDRMETLGTRINQLSDDISKMKLVLDTGVVAGGIADILDREYARRGFYASRQ